MAEQCLLVRDFMSRNQPEQYVRAQQLPRDTPLPAITFTQKIINIDQQQKQKEQNNKLNAVATPISPPSSPLIYPSENDSQSPQDKLPSSPSKYLANRRKASYYLQAAGRVTVICRLRLCDLESYVPCVNLKKLIKHIITTGMISPKTKLNADKSGYVLANKDWAPCFQRWVISNLIESGSSDILGHSAKHITNIQRGADTIIQVLSLYIKLKAKKCKKSAIANEESSGDEDGEYNLNNAEYGGICVVEKYEICCEVAMYFFINDLWAQSNKWFKRAKLWHSRFNEANELQLSNDKYEWSKMKAVVRVLSVILNKKDSQKNDDLYDCLQQIIDGKKESALKTKLLEICGNLRGLRKLSCSLLNVWLHEMQCHCKNDENTAHFQIFLIVYSMFNRSDGDKGWKLLINHNYDILNSKQQYFEFFLSLSDKIYQILDTNDKQERFYDLFIKKMDHVRVEQTDFNFGAIKSLSLHCRHFDS